MKKILVPTDFSQTSENALRVAADLARKFDSKIFLLHMLELPMDLINPVMGTRTNDLPEVLFFTKRAEQRLKQLIEQDFLEGVSIRPILQLHHTLDGIMETRQRENCDLIVMGSQGASGLQEMFIGSNTEKVVRRSHVPVLVIKEPIPEFKAQTMVFGIDFTDKSREVLSQVILFAETLGAKLHLVYVHTGNEEDMRDVKNKHATFLKGLDREALSCEVYPASFVEEGILEYADTINADLVGMATHGRKGLSHFFNGSISEDIANHAKRPVVTFRLPS